MQTQPSDLTAVAEPPGLVTEPPGPVVKRQPRTWVKRYMPDQVNTVLRDYDAGMGAEAIRAKHQVSKATLYRWIAQYHDQVTVDNDPVCMRMRIAALEKAVLNLSVMLVERDREPGRERDRERDREPGQEAIQAPLGHEAIHAPA